MVARKISPKFVEVLLVFFMLLFVSRAHETANEARRVNKQLKECQAQSQLFNSRERLFNMSVTNVCAILFFNPLRANPIKWSKVLKQFVDKLPTSCLSVFDRFVWLALKGLKSYSGNHHNR